MFSFFFHLLIPKISKGSTSHSSDRWNNLRPAGFWSHRKKNHPLEQHQQNPWLFNSIESWLVNRDPYSGFLQSLYEPGSKLLVLGMVIQPLMTGILIMGPYKPLRTWVDFSHPLLYGNVMWVDRPDRTYNWVGFHPPFLTQQISPVIHFRPPGSVTLGKTCEWFDLSLGWSLDRSVSWMFFL